jgi:hypothetical protein
MRVTLVFCSWGVSSGFSGGARKFYDRAYSHSVIVPLIMLRRGGGEFAVRWLCVLYPLTLTS